MEPTRHVTSRQVFDDRFHLAADMELEADALHVGPDRGHREAQLIRHLFVDTTMTTTISGLALNTNYMVLVYHADDHVSEAVTVNGVAGSDFTGSVGSTGYVDAFDTLTGSDFWYFSSVNSGGSGVLTILSAGTAPGSHNTITGFQLQAIPEPSAALLGGLGMIALLRRRR